MTLDQALERIADLEDQIHRMRSVTGADDAARVSAATGANGLELTTLMLLMKRGELSREVFIATLYGDRVDGGPTEAHKMLDITICKLRKKVAAIGVTIRTVWGYGYSISERDQKLLREILERETT